MARPGGIGRWIARLVIALVVTFVVVVGIGILLLQSSAVSRRVKDMVVPRASAALGRDVAVEDAKLRIIPGPRVDLTGVTVAGRPGEPPLVELAALELSLRFWPLVTSLGKDVEVASIRLSRPVISLVRAPDGTWNASGLGKGPGAAGTPAPGAVSPSGRAAESPATAPAESRKVVVAHAAIDDGTIRIIDRSLPNGPSAVAASHIQLSADHVGLGEPLDAKLSAAIAGPEPNLHARIHADRLPASMAALGPGQYPQLTGDLALTGFELARVRDFLPASVTGMMTGGRVDVSARLSTVREAYHVDGSGRLSEVRLRGEPASGGFELHAALDAAKGAVHATLDRLALKGPGIDLGGDAAIDAMPLRVRFAIEGPLLDLGQVMGLLPPSAPKPAGTPLLTSAQRQAVQAADVSGTIAIAKVVKGALVADAFKARTALDRGSFVLQEATAELFGGRVDASGTRVDLAPAVPTWNLQAKLGAVDMGRALTALTGAAPVLGKLDGALALDGAGVDWATLRNQLTGHGSVILKDAALTTTDLGSDVLGAVATGLRAAGKSAAATSVSGASGKTPLQNVSAEFTVKDGALKLSRPLSFGAPFGSGALGGTIGLDGALGLSGDVVLSKQTLASVLGNLAGAAPATVRVPVALGGTLSHPAVNVNAQQVVASLAGAAVRGQLQQLQNKAQEEGKGALQKGLGDFLKGRLGK